MITKEELKAILHPNWFEDPSELILDSFDEFYLEVTNGVEPTDENFASIVNANVEDYNVCRAQSSYWY
ncbi:hypothetical protein [Dysgonomonas macrotermitis]|uniref:Uncharacterized protein n=1 Tax=Dysgonomonas macrotermitis TaxID=1346286 RepID=A0A1M5IVU2_9BACT|nr:hypothetical protein [Dysgonomonas macrotermitis]SHG32265.1 hypothetical protein SAMN05444362_12131 [Dysgonomonas macrotermitis]